MDKNKHPIEPDITQEIMNPKEPEVQFYLEEMQKMNNQMIDMQRELNRALRESRRVQEELRHSDELKKALEVAERADRAKMDFMSRMSHDLRTPMNVIMGLVAATLDEAENPEAVRANMAHIRSASDYMLGLVNDILDMAKVEKDNIEFKLEPYNYSEFLLETKTTFQAQCDSKHIHFICEDLPSAPLILADKVRLKQIIFNILSNAVKYTQPDGTIKVTSRIRQIDRLENHVWIEYRVEDNGIGMSEDFQKHLFEPFVQEDNTISPELRGSGLGLSITKRLVEQMGGAIHIDSQKGRGTTVTLNLPFTLAPDQVVQKAAASASETGRYDALHGKSVLLAEDHPLNAMITRKLLEKVQINVLHAENGRLAVEFFQSSPLGSLDAILMDIRMPEMNGLEAAKVIRSLRRTDAAAIPIIALSANTYPADIQSSLDAGMNAHLAKPIDADTLYRTLEKCFRG